MEKALLIIGLLAFIMSAINLFILLRILRKINWGKPDLQERDININGIDNDIRYIIETTTPKTPK
jgi:hypothetical protein